MQKFDSIYGGVIALQDIGVGGDAQSLGCNKIMSLRLNNDSLVNFIIFPDTYFLDQAVISPGDVVEAFYDANAPTLAIYPPQYNAIVVALVKPGRNVKVDFFDDELVSSDGSLKLNIGPSTKIILENGQLFTQNIANHQLIVAYGPTTKSIPAQTTPEQIIVMCPKV